MSLLKNIGVKMIMNIIYNEKTVLDKFLNENRCDISVNKLIPILIKYHYKNGIEDKLKLRERILEDLYNLDNTNLRSVWINKVDKCIKYFMKNIRKDEFVTDIIDVDSVDIYEEELIFIDNVKEFKYKKLLFIMLVWTKVYRKFNKNVVSEKIIDLLKLSKCETRNKSYRNSLLHYIKKREFAWIKFENKTYYTKINYLKEEGEIAFTVDDIENAIYYYLNWSGERWIKCSECGEYFKKPKSKANNIRYCNKCSKKIELKKNSERVKKCIKKKDTRV